MNEKTGPMKNYTKVAKHVEEKIMTAEKKKARSQQRDKKHVAWDEAIVVEDPPQSRPRKSSKKDLNFGSVPKTRKIRCIRRTPTAC